jgi:hypothetical protein
MGNAIRYTPVAEVGTTESGWLALFRSGWTISDVADDCDEEYDRVRDGIARARLREATKPQAPGPRLTLLFGASCKAKPTCQDIHPGGPIPRGSHCCCSDCHKTGIEDHPVFKIGPNDEPPPPTTPILDRRKPNRSA